MGQTCNCKQVDSLAVSIKDDAIKETYSYEQQDYQISGSLQPLRMYETLPLPSNYSFFSPTEDFSEENNVPQDNICDDFVPQFFEKPNLPIIQSYVKYPKSDKAFKFDQYKYIGQWKQQEPIGLGTYYYNDGGIYYGYSFYQLPHNYGLKIYPDGSSYEGEFELGIIQGQGKLQNKQLTFEGQWNTNMPINGIETWSDGTIYIGQYQNGQKCGNGLMQWKNGNKYEGQFEQDQFNGYGKYIFIDGFIYEGEWINSQMHGNGKLIYPNGSYFEGQFINDLQCSGIIITQQGSKKSIQELSNSTLTSTSIVMISRPSLKSYQIQFRSLEL